MAKSAKKSAKKHAKKAARPAPARERPARKSSPAKAAARPTAEAGRGAGAPRSARPSATAGENAGAPEKVFPVEVEPGSLEETLKRVREELKHWANRGRYTKVRLKLRGKPLLPDLPVAAFLAAEAVSFWWAGLLRVLLVNVGAKALLDVELISEADEEVSRGKALLLGGDLDQAMAAFRKALEMDRDCASAHLNLGIAYRLQGKHADARDWLQKAEQLDPAGPVGEEARRLLDQSAGQKS